MKNLSIRLFALILSVAMIFSVTGCGNTEESSIVVDGNISVDATDVSDDAASAESKKENTASTGSTASKNNTSSGKQDTASVGSTIKIDPTKPKTSLTRDQVIAKMPAKLKGTTLKYMYWWNPKTQMEKDAIASFEKKTGITLEPIVASYWGFYGEVASRIAAGNSPDIVRMMSNTDSNIDLLQPITNSGFDFNDTAWDSEVLADYTFNGKTYAVNLANSAVMDYCVVYYNKNALKAAEMQDDPYTIWKNNPKDWTWAKFWSMCSEFVKANKNSADTYYGATFEYPDHFVRAMGGSIYNYNSEKGKFVNTLDSSAMKVGWKRTTDAIDKKWLKKDHDVTLFDSGKILFFTSGPYSVRKGDARQEALKKQNALGIVPLPTDSKTRMLYEYTAFGICKGAKNAAAAPYYLRWVLDQASYNMKEIWVNDEAYNVMQYVEKQDNTFYGAYWYEAFYNDMYSGGSKQVESVLDSYSNIIDLYVKQANERIALY